jgi:hypothetical protein
MLHAHSDRPPDTDSAARTDRSRMTDELELFQAAILERLRCVGVQLPDAQLRQLADDMLAEAVRLSVAWLEQE